MKRLSWLAIAIAMSCGSIPQTRYYALALPKAEPRAEQGRGVLTVDELSVSAAYDDQRIVYRKSPYRFDYYEYHQWNSVPSQAITEYVRDALAQSGRFARVTGELSKDTTLVLRGRIAALEEVDLTPTEWAGRLDLELYAVDPATDKVVWSRRFREQRPLPTQHPSGLAQALSAVLAQIVTEAAPEISRAADRVQREESSTSPLAR